MERKAFGKEVVEHYVHFFKVEQDQASDGIIEAVEMSGHPWLVAVQWHPELTAATDPVQQRLFDGLVKAAIVRRSNNFKR